MRIKDHYFEILSFVLFGISTLVFIWSNRILPFQDLPDWLFQGYIFSSFLDGTMMPEYQIAGYYIPNIASTLIIGILSQLFSIAVAGKICITLFIIIFSIGSVYCITSLNSGKINTLILIPILLVLNNSLFKGNLNYVVSLGVLFFGMGYILRATNEGKKINYWFLALLSILIFYSHGISYALWISFLIFVLFFHAKERRVNFKYLLAILPSIFLLIFYLSSGILNQYSGKVVELSFFQNISFKVHSVIDYFSVFQKFSPFYHYEKSYFLIYSGALLNLCFLILFIYVIASYYKTKKDKNWGLFIFPMILLLAFLISPYYICGVYNPGQRILYPIAFLLLSIVVPHYKNIFCKLTRTVLRAFLFGLLLVQICYVHFYVRAISDELEMNILIIDEKLVNGNHQDDFLTLFAPDFQLPEYIESYYTYTYSFINKFVPDIRPFSRIPYYLNIKYQTHTHIFPTGIVKDLYSFEKPISVDKAIRLNKPSAIVSIFNSKEEHRYLSNMVYPAYSIVYENNYMILLDNRKDKIMQKKENQ